MGRNPTIFRTEKKEADFIKTEKGGLSKGLLKVL